MNRYGWLAVAAVMMVITAFSASALANSDWATGAGLSPQQAAQLRALDMPIAVPTDVSARFEVIEVRTTAGKASGWPPPHYRIVYAGDGATCFRIESASGGIGGPAPPDSRWAVYPFAFLPPSASAPWYVYFTGHMARRPFLPYMVFSDWLQHGKWLYRLSSGFQRMDNCGSISPRQAARIVESLAFLDTKPALAAAAFEAMPRYQAFSFQSPGGVSAADAAIEALASMNLLAAQADRSVRVLAESEQAARLLVTQSHLRDDSVAAQRYRLTLVQKGSNWVLQDIAVQQRCYRAPERDWAAAPCP